MKYVIIGIILAFVMIIGIRFALKKGKQPIPEIEGGNTSDSSAWHYFPCSMEGETAFVMVNTGISKIIDQAPPALVIVTLPYKQPSSEGLPGQEEFDVAGEIEDRIQDFTVENDDWYLGRITVGGHRYFYIYTNASQASWDGFTQKLSDSTGYELKTDLMDDPEHASYWEFLYPSADDWQVIKDIQVLEVLKKHGDDGHEPRKVDHWAYFENQEAAQPFIDWAIQDRFTFDSELSHETDEGTYCVRLVHHGSMDLVEINNHTIMLRRKAEEFGGDYDGWETQVLASD